MMAISKTELTQDHLDRKVIYIPRHAYGDRSHPDCEIGVITSFNQIFVFVRYGDRVNPQATSPEDLRWEF